MNTPTPSEGSPKRPKPVRPLPEGIVLAPLKTDDAPAAPAPISQPPTIRPPAPKPPGATRQPLSREPVRSAPQKPIAPMPVAPPIVPAAKRPAPPPPVAPLPPRPAAQRSAPQKPVAPTPAAPLPAAPSTPIITLPARETSVFGPIAAVLLAGALICGAWWYFSNLPNNTTKTVVVTEAPPPEEKPTPAPERRELPIVAMPEPEKKPVVVADAPAPAPAAPLPNTPVPPKPAVAAADPFDGTLLLDATGARSPIAEQRAATLLRTALTENKWPQYLAMLTRSVEAELKKSPDFETPQRFDRFTSNPYFMRAMLQLAIGNLASDDARKLISENDATRQLVTWVFESNESMESFLQVVEPEDNLRNVFETWSVIAADDTDAIGKYRELAIACSVIIPKVRTINWNGHDEKISGVDRYRWYKAKDKAGQLATKITELTGWQLTWVVGVPVPESEMQWAIDELERKLKQKNWGNAYGMVPYDMQKAVTGKMKDPYDYYTFAEILKKGGVCGDRAYFCANTARSVGIPAASISGDGPGGPHAWVGWLAEEDRWGIDGRIGGYPAGHASDPRGKRVSEQLFNRLSDKNAPGPEKELRARRLVWIHELLARLHQDKNADFALDFALRTSPHSADLYERKIQYWASLVPPPAASVWKPFLDKLRREYSEDTAMLDLARDAEDKYVLAKLDAASAKNELRGDVRDLAKLKGLTSLEEIVTAHKRYADLFAPAKDYTSIRRVYRDALDDYGREPAKFKALARDYWGYLGDAPPEVRLTGARDIDRAYERHVETKNAGYFDTKSQITAAEFVEKCWREVGETAKADRIKKDNEKRGAKATKNAL